MDLVACQTRDLPSFLSCREGTRFTSQHPSQHLRAVSRDMPGVIWGMTGGYVSWELSGLPRSRQITTTGHFSLLCITCPGRPCWHWDEAAGRTWQGRSPIPHPAPSLTLPFPAPRKGITHRRLMQTLPLSTCLQQALSRQLQRPAGLRLQPAHWVLRVSALMPPEIF